MCPLSLRRGSSRAPQDRGAHRPSACPGWRSWWFRCAESRWRGGRGEPEGGSADQLAGAGSAAAGEVGWGSVGSDEASLDRSAGRGRTSGAVHDAYLDFVPKGMIPYCPGVALVVPPESVATSEEYSRAFSDLGPYLHHVTYDASENEGPGWNYLHFKKQIVADTFVWLTFFGDPRRCRSLLVQGATRTPPKVSPGSFLTLSLSLSTACLNWWARTLMGAFCGSVVQVYGRVLR